MYNIKFGHRTWHFSRCRNFIRTKSQNNRSYLEAPDNQAVRQSAPWVPTLFRLENYHLVPDQKENIGFSSGYCWSSYIFLSFVILMNNLSSRAPVTPKGKKQERQKLFLKNDCLNFPHTILFLTCPSAFSRYMSLDLSSPDILITS